MGRETVLFDRSTGISYLALLGVVPTARVHRTGSGFPTRRICKTQTKESLRIVWKIYARNSLQEKLAQSAKSNKEINQQGNQPTRKSPTRDYNHSILST